MLSWLLEKLRRNGSDNHQPKKYEKGNLIVKKENRVSQLCKHDEQAKEIYDGFENHISRLKKITIEIKKRQEQENG